MSRYVKFCPICNETGQNMEWCGDEKYKEFSKGFFNVCVPKDNITICPACQKGILEDTVLTHDEFNLIEDVSDSDRPFLEAMIELKKTDPIEYQLKISQFKTQLKQQESSKKTEDDNRPKCPTCGSTDLSKISTMSKAGSVFMWGLFSQKVKKTWHCNNCTYEW